ncbi:TetR/AcrR family transcriptional regulator [Actinorugispora endophytica]|uniref:TetR family transcriptional regulator n=1 Tax=Actinorugispora endophytica TaxID=1605990 RepID=A0A4R6VD27_9ACTN|nr:TetR family transcriptional regulator [Actinorugispora endophytica]TDQ54887.1 TetR family transcriptional regulator [Actinorugispora endophytica]
MARTGRRPGATRTREEILQAARADFGEKGYNGASVRGIARRAGVDPALVHHYFGSKDQVFVAAMELPYDPGDVLERVMLDTGQDPAEAVLRVFLQVWGDPRTQAPMLALIRSAVGTEQAADIVRGFMGDVLLRRIAPRLGVSPLRASLVASQLFGMVLVRYVIRVEPLASASPEDVVALYAPAVRLAMDLPKGP